MTENTFTNLNSKQQQLLQELHGGNTLARELPAGRKPACRAERAEALNELLLQELQHQGSQPTVDKILNEH